MLIPLPTGNQAGKRVGIRYRISTFDGQAWSIRPVRITEEASTKRRRDIEQKKRTAQRG